MGELHVVLGAAGGTGRALIRELARRGLPTRPVVRSPAGIPVEMVSDVSEPSHAARAIEGAAVVYHAAQPRYTRWATEFPPLTSSVTDAAAAAGAKLVLADNLYMYGPITGPLSEGSPQRPESEKGKVRLAMAEELLERHRRGDLRVAIGRSSDYYGAHGTRSALGEPLFGALVAGKKPRWLGDPDVDHTEHYLDDIARGLVVLGTSEAADGEVWHLPAAEPMSGRDFVALAARTVGRDPAFTHTTRRIVRLAGVFVPMIRALGDVLYQWEQPFTIDATKFQRSFGPLQPTPHEEAVTATLSWFHRRA